MTVCSFQCALRSTALLYNATQFVPKIKNFVLILCVQKMHKFENILPGSDGRDINRLHTICLMECYFETLLKRTGYNLAKL